MRSEKSCCIMFINFSQPVDWRIFCNDQVKTTRVNNVRVAVCQISYSCFHFFRKFYLQHSLPNFYYLIHFKFCHWINAICCQASRNRGVLTHQILIVITNPYNDELCPVLPVGQLLDKSRHILPCRGFFDYVKFIEDYQVGAP